jgi:hypothetical protein
VPASLAGSAAWARPTVRDRAGNQAPADGQLLQLGAALPAGVELGSNYPNPFNPTTAIPFTIPAGQAATVVQLTIYDVAGQEVRILLRGEVTGGRHQAIWDGRDDRGEQVGSGVYLYRLESGSHVQTRQMLLIK